MDLTLACRRQPHYARRTPQPWCTFALGGPRERVDAALLTARWQRWHKKCEAYTRSAEGRDLEDRGLCPLFFVASNQTSLLLLSRAALKMLCIAPCLQPSAKKKTRCFLALQLQLTSTRLNTGCFLKGVATPCWGRGHQGNSKASMPLCDITRGL